jgi:hypothetical protein
MHVTSNDSDIPRPQLGSVITYITLIDLTSHKLTSLFTQAKI